ncbi:MAG: hypothetical protein LPH21_16595 [Shewanella sp.]|nr:hypothetical protein [Shewanella sp.]MCF1430303.1 hypothetical protein [Shewanella sp.]MCF1459094.1 hypothetical protein [Shewanella sp.]
MFSGPAHRRLHRKSGWCAIGGRGSEAWFGANHYPDYPQALAATTDLGGFTLSDTDLVDDDVKAVVGYSYQFDL